MFDKYNKAPKKNLLDYYLIDGDAMFQGAVIQKAAAPKPLLEGLALIFGQPEFVLECFDGHLVKTQKYFKF